MKFDDQLLIVGGTARNVGKTEFVCRLITSICRKYPVYGLKVSAIFPDEGIYHGNHTDDMPTRQVVEETRLYTGKDTSRMLQAGARRVFYLRSEDNGIFPSHEHVVSAAIRKRMEQDPSWMLPWMPYPNTAATD